MTTLPGEQQPPPSGRPATLARRLVPAIVLIGAGGALVYALDRPGSVPTPPTGDLAAADVTSTVPTTVAPTTTTTRPGQTTTTIPGNRTTTTTTVPTAPACTGNTHAVTGSTITTRFGPVQVAAVVDADERLCTLSAPQSPSNDRRSQSINAQAIPILNTRGAAAGSTKFTGVSGATYTSTAYKQSLQSILDAL